MKKFFVTDAEDVFFFKKIGLLLTDSEECFVAMNADLFMKREVFR